MFKQNKIKLPPEFRRKPFYKRLPEWFARQFKGVGRRPLNDPSFNPSYRPAHVRMQQGFEKGLDRSLYNVQQMFRAITRTRIPLWILVPISFVLGAGITFGVMKQRRAASDVILAVEGAKITSPDFMHRMETQIGSQTIHAMLQEELNLRFAESRKLLPTPAQVQARIKQMKMQPDFDRLVQERHMTEADIERQCLVQLTNEALYTQHISVTEEEGHSYYTANTDPRNPRSLFYVPESAQLSVITNTLESNIQKANQELAQGKSIAEVARRYSQDKTGGIAGKMPPIWRGRTQFATAPALETEILQARPGQRIGPRRFYNTWWIIRVDRVDPARTVSYDQVRQQCLAGARYMKAVRTNQPQLEADLTDFRKKAKIQVFWDQYYYDLTGQRRK